MISRTSHDVDFLPPNRGHGREQVRIDARESRFRIRKRVVSFPFFAMPKYRVTYVESILREAVVHAQSPQEAEDRVLEQKELAEHHHAVDVWEDDWQAEEYKRAAVVNRHCFECGDVRA